MENCYNGDCSDAFKNIPLENPELGEQCAQKFSTDCVFYEGVTHADLGISPGQSLTSIIQILALDEGATPLTQVSSEDSDHIVFSGVGTLADPLVATLNVTPALADQVLDQMLLDPAILSNLNAHINSVLPAAVAPVGCVINSENVFLRVDPGPVHRYGITDSEATARYQIATWDQVQNFGAGYVNQQIKQVGNDGEVTWWAPRSSSIKWRIRKYCGLDNSGNQLFSDWVQGPEILPF